MSDVVTVQVRIEIADTGLYSMSPRDLVRHVMMPRDVAAKFVAAVKAGDTEGIEVDESGLLFDGDRYSIDVIGLDVIDAAVVEGQ